MTYIIHWWTIECVTTTFVRLQVSMAWFVRDVTLQFKWLFLSILTVFYNYFFSPDRRRCTLGYERASFAFDVWDWSVGLLQLQCCSGAARRYCGRPCNTGPVATLSYKSRLLSLCEAQEKKDGRLAHAHSGKSLVMLSSGLWSLFPTEMFRRYILNMERCEENTLKWIYFELLNKHSQKYQRNIIVKTG